MYEVLIPTFKTLLFRTIQNEIRNCLTSILKLPLAQILNLK